jgi:hypothetical protein
MAESKMSDDTAIGGQSSRARVAGENEVIERLEKYEDPQVTDQLYDFGSKMVRDVIERLNSLETKAGILAGFAGAMIVVVVSTFSSWKDLIHDWPIASIFLFLGIIVLLIAAGSALMGLRVMTFEGLHERDLWFASEYFQHPDRLRRYYLVGMYRKVVSHNSINDRKADMLWLTERLILVGAVLLAIPLLLEIWQLGIKQELSSLFNCLGWRRL